MTAQYPSWVYSDVDPPQLVTGPAQVAALPAGFSSSPSVNAMVLPSVVPAPPTTVFVSPSSSSVAPVKVVNSKGKKS